MEGVLHPFIADIALLVRKGFADGVFPVRRFAAIHASAREQRREFGNGYAIDLILENMVDAFLLVGHEVFQPEHEPFGNFAQKYARFANGV
ncbi:hypothetical protein FACS189430_08820 [Bacteroidia bacterium]|nr:hypothetical protein FACS189430_08820 [Bacteroidia bacterium]